ncbi:MAG TPA: hypothetical protein VHM69_14005 [Rubrobacter sp.]|nr:hypothetical protein [Rubrobacter sp.]
MLRERRPAESLSEATGGRPELSLRYRELLEPLGFAREVSSLFADSGGPLEDAPGRPWAA